MRKEVFILIEKALRRQKLIKIVVGSFLLVFSLMGIILSFSNLSLSIAFATSVLLGMIAFVGAMLLKNAYQAYLDECHFWNFFLKNEGRKIVWVYYHKLENLPFGISLHSQTTLFIHLDDRSKACIAMREPEILEIMSVLRSELPKATFGYSKQKEQLYNIGPDLLRK